MKEFVDKLKTTYNDFYSNGMWSMLGGGSKSGLGSSIKYTKSYSENLVDIIEKYNINKVFDCSCGDWFWMQHLEKSFKYYVGNDICEKLIYDNKNKFECDNIKFVSNDMLSQMKTLSDFEFDLSICRHTFEHLPTDYNIECIKEIKRVSRYAIITSSNHININQDIKINFDNYIGRSRGLNLDTFPYSNMLPTPLLKFWDSIDENKSSIGVFGYLYKFD